MDVKEIQELIKFVAKSGVSEVELESKGFRLVIKTGKSDAVIYQAAPAVPQVISAPAPVVATAPAPVAPSEPVKQEVSSKAEDSSRYIEFRSPMIGTFYRRPSPDKPLYVNVGDSISPGSVICVIEAMKLFNEIESDVKGKIVKVLVEDASPVEYDQPLFLIDPA